MASPRQIARHRQELMRKKFKQFMVEGELQQRMFREAVNAMPFLERAGMAWRVLRGTL